MVDPVTVMAVVALAGKLAAAQVVPTMAECQSLLHTIQETNKQTGEEQIDGEVRFYCVPYDVWHPLDDKLGQAKTRVEKNTVLKAASEAFLQEQFEVK